MLMIEEWRPVLGFETLYEVSNLGKVRSLPKTVHLGYENRGTVYFAGGPLKPRFNKYSLVVHLYDNKTGSGKRLKNKNFSVSRLVYEAFKEPIPQGLLVKMMDGDPWNCSFDNLKLVSRAELLELNARGRTR